MVYGLEGEGLVAGWVFYLRTLCWSTLALCRAAGPGQPPPSPLSWWSCSSSSSSDNLMQYQINEVCRGSIVQLFNQAFSLFLNSGHKFIFKLWHLEKSCCFLWPIPSLFLFQGVYICSFLRGIWNHPCRFDQADISCHCPKLHICGFFYGYHSRPLFFVHCTVVRYCSYFFLPDQ